MQKSHLTYKSVWLAVWISPSVLAEPVEIGQVEHILPAEVSQSDQFGRRVALDNSFLAAGAPQDSDAGQNAGSVYIFELDSEQRWQQVRKIVAVDAEPFDEFGRDVDLEGDLLVAGAPEALFAGTDAAISHVPNAGSAYVFRRDAGGANNWGQVAKLTADDGQLGDDFGRAVAISGYTAVAGARLTDESGFFSGSAYVFERTPADESWLQTQKLTASDASAGTFFGDDVAIDADVMAIGAPDELFAPTSPGKVYVYTKSVIGWLETAILTGSTAIPGDRLGTTVTVSGNTIAAGAFGSGIDRVFVFERVPGTFDWVEAAALTAPCAESNSDFGHAVALKDDLLLVGAPYDDEAAENAGAIFVYERHTGGPNQWGFVAKVVATDSSSLDQFGAAVGVSGGAIATGAPGSDMAGRDGGLAYSAQLYSLDTDADGIADLLDNCLEMPNGPETVGFAGPSQRDSDADGFGNMCDADLNNDCDVNFADLAMMQSVFFGPDDHADFNGDGVVNFSDLNLMISSFFATPGPSAVQTCNTWSLPRPQQQNGSLQVITSLDCQVP